MKKGEVGAVGEGYLAARNGLVSPSKYFIFSIRVRVASGLWQLAVQQDANLHAGRLAGTAATFPAINEQYIAFEL